MSTPFSQTMRALRSDHYRTVRLGLLIAVLFLMAWLAWFVFAEVILYEVSVNARLEADQASHPVQALLSGRVQSTHMGLDRQVTAGEILVEMDAARETHQLAEKRAYHAALENELTILKKEIAAAENALEQDRRAGVAGLAEAQARLAEATSAAQVAAEAAGRVSKLHANELASEVELQRARADSAQKQSATAALAAVVVRLEREQELRLSDRSMRLEQLRGQQARLEGDLAVTATVIRQLESEIEKFSIRAPVAGTLGEVSPRLQPGAFLEEGEQVAQVIPSGEIRAVALFRPYESLGRIRAGQAARLRLEGFPWAQYGTVKATVTNVGSEIREGMIRVELAVDRASANLIPLQHGLPGLAEIEVERISPALLVLRTVGELLSSAPQRESSAAGVAQ